MRYNDKTIIWREVSWLRPFELANVQELLTHLAALSPCGYIVWEVRGSGGKVRYLLGTDKYSIGRVEDVFHTHANVQLSRATVDRKPVTVAKRVKVTKPILSLRTDGAPAVTRAVLSVMAQCKADEETVIQIILGASFAPAPMPNNPSDPHPTWLDLIMGNIAPPSGETKNALREKINLHGFNTVIRIGAAVESRNADSGDNDSDNTHRKALNHVLGLISGLRILESAGVRLPVTPENPGKLDNAYRPWHFPLRLSIKELSNLFLLPTGDGELPGTAGLHPKLLLPPKWLQNPGKIHTRCFGVSADQSERPLNITPRDSLEHTIILGPTGSGKSTAMLNLILADIDAGRGVLVIDPKHDLVNDVLERIPDNRINDVVVLDPSDAKPVGFNPLSVDSCRNRGLVADTVLAVLREIFADSWGVRTQDILSGALLTLVQTENASLVMLPMLLTDAGFRRRVLAGITDQVGLLPFWAGYEAMGNAERNQVIAPVLNKLRQFILRPELRNILGQTEPKFRLEELFNKRRIVLVPLNKGIIGAENARLLGSLIVGLTWALALSRADLPPERRHITSVFIDELQDYISLPTNLSDALAQARGLGVGITMAHQYRAQLTPEIRAGIDANARNKIVFGLNAPDAKELSAQAPELTLEDFMYLPRFEVYVNLQIDGKATGWVSGKTKPMPPTVRNAAEAKAVSQARYGRDADETEREYLAALGHKNPYGAACMANSDGKNEKAKGGDCVIGRKRRDE